MKVHLSEATYELVRARAVQRGVPMRRVLDVAIRSALASRELSPTRRWGERFAWRGKLRTNQPGGSVFKAVG